MRLTSSGPVSRFQRSAVALAMAAASASAFALPEFTLNPDAAIATAPAADITADSIKISDFSTVRFTSPTTFTDVGFLNVSSFELGSAPVITTGLGVTYGLYFAFEGTGTVTAGNPASVNTTGNFDTLTYRLYGYTGPANFGFDASNNAMENVGGDVLLASGTLRTGTVSSAPNTDPAVSGPFYANANLSLDFVIEDNAAANAFFASPESFYNIAIAAFTNTPDTVTLLDGAVGFTIRQGGGTVSFATAPIPEPETYALMLAGLAAVGFVARRRRPIS